MAGGDSGGEGSRFPGAVDGAGSVETAGGHGPVDGADADADADSR